jgi:Domain of unknown function (DUF4349)
MNTPARKRFRAPASAPTSLGLVSRLFFILAVALVTQTGCSKAEPSHSASARVESSPAPGQGASAAMPAASPLPEERAMRITVEMSVVVAHRDVAVRGLRAALADFGGYVSNGSVAGPDATGSASFEVKVPASRVEAFRAAVRSLGDVRADTEKAEDVTEARADVRARLGNARAEETRMVALLGEKTGTLADVMAVERELARVRETIERFEAEERVLLGQIAMATVKVDLGTSFVASAPGAGSRLAEAAHDGIETAWGFLLGTGVFLLAAGPTLLILVLFALGAFFGGRNLRRRVQRARMVATFAEPRM